MIRHTPRGRGHGYRASLDQRDPFLPVAGSPVSIAVLASAPVVLELERDGRVATIDLPPIDSVDAARSLGDRDGHLAAAAEAGEDTGGLDAFRAEVGPFAATERVRYRIRTGDAREMTAWFDLPVAEWTPGPAPTVDGGATDRLIADSTSWLTASGGDASRVRFALRLEPGEHVVGLGERFHSLDQVGRAVDATVFEQYRDQGERTYLPVPFAHVVGGSGWGFHVDTTRRVWFDVGANAPGELWIEALVEQPELEVHLWSGEPPEVLEQFFGVVGRPAGIPEWAYRPWASANDWNTQERVEAEVARSIAEGVPIGVVVIEAWSDEGTIHIWRDAQYAPRTDGEALRFDDFTFPADGAWPDPKGMIDRLHEQGVRVVLWQIPVVPDHQGEHLDKETDAIQLVADRVALLERGFAVLEEDGSPYRNRGWWFPKAMLPDFTQSEARAWWTDKRRYLVEDMGVDGFKTDGGEHAWGDELRYGDGTRGIQTNNRFANLYAQAFHELMDSVGIEGITFSRAGHAGAGSFPAHWAGDEQSTWEAYRASVIAGLTAGASGIFLWSWDHGGFSGELPTAELYLRSGAMAVFSPIMQYHAEYNARRIPSRDRTPWNVAEQTGDPRALTVYRELAALRERLIPYLLEQTQHSLDRSTPLLRAMFVDHPRDERIWERPLQYRLGEDLLVSPVTEPGATEWTTYLPVGEERWVDAWTGELHDGGQLVTRAVPLEIIPVYVRESAWKRMAPVFTPA
jgi:alpha-glucosidase (family GH31 glycosyl hydrolase)